MCLAQQGLRDHALMREFYTYFQGWLDALILYTTSTGDMVIRNAEDKTAWALMAENRVTPFAPSFAGFLEVCTKSYNLGFISITISRMRLPEGPRITSLSNQDCLKREWHRAVSSPWLLSRLARSGHQ